MGNYYIMCIELYFRKMRRALEKNVIDEFICVNEFNATDLYTQK